MLSKFKVKRYKSLFDVDIDLEPLTVFIGPNGSGKSNICEALAVISDFLQKLTRFDLEQEEKAIALFIESLQAVNHQDNAIISKLWHGHPDSLTFEAIHIPEPRGNHIPGRYESKVVMIFGYSSQTIGILTTNEEGELSGGSDISKWREIMTHEKYINSAIGQALRRIKVYDFAPISLASPPLSTSQLGRTGQGIAYALVDILHANRSSFDELESRLRQLVPNIRRILLPRGENQTFSLGLVDKYSEHHIPISDISDGTLRILAFLTALYQEETPSIICFEEPENGIHPWLLHKMMELLKLVSTEGITGKPVQVLITTHSPVLLNYVEPHQVRAVELDHEGKTQVHALPVESARFQKAMEAYDGALGELWFTNVFGGNPA